MPQENMFYEPNGNFEYVQINPIEKQKSMKDLKYDKTIKAH